MDSKLLLLISFITCLSGLILLYTLVDNIEVGNLNESTIDGIVSFYGEVSKVNKYENVMFVQINREVETEVVIFEDIELFKGERVEIIGEKQGERLIAKRIRVI